MKKIIAAVMLFGLCACGRGGDVGAVEGGAGKAEPAPVMATTADTDDSVDDVVDVAADVPREFCSFLEDEVPRLKERGSRIAALARFAADYAGWIGEDAERVIGAGSELDSITSTTCPSARKKVLDVLDRDTLAKALGL